MAEHSALAATAAAHNDQSLATMNFERDVVEHRAVPDFSDEVVSPQ